VLDAQSAPKGSEIKTIKRTSVTLWELVVGLQALEKLLDLAALNLDTLSGHRGGPSTLIGSVSEGVAPSPGRWVVRIEVGQFTPLRTRVIKKEALGPEKLTDDWNVALRGTNKGFQRQNRELRRAQGQKR
jgi:hypothetical protein